MKMKLSARGGRPCWLSVQGDVTVRKCVFSGSSRWCLLVFVIEIITSLVRLEGGCLVFVIGNRSLFGVIERESDYKIVFVWCVR